MSIAPTNSSLVGIQRGFQNLNRISQNIATAGVEGNLDVGALARSAVELKATEQQIKASAASLKTENETIGTLLDVIA